MSISLHPYRDALITRTQAHKIAPCGGTCSDAAHSIHPLAGQGLNLGISEATALVSALCAGASAGADPGSLVVLRDFGRRNYAIGAGTALAMDAIKRMFSLGAGADASHNAWIPVRNIGMSVLNRAGPAKSLLMHVATGAWRR
jgi:2-polyprenyl-6-methoxyphenol hydroxylase-like FAD-dependent oxidoreductase